MDNAHRFNGTRQIPLALCDERDPAPCRPTCDQQCDVIRKSLLEMLGHPENSGGLGNHQLQHILRSRTLRQLQPLHAGIRSVPCERNCCGGDGILVLPGAEEAKTIVLADINGHGSIEQPPLHDLFAMITKIARDHGDLGGICKQANLAFAAWREVLEDQDAAHIPYAECAFVRMEKSGMVEAVVAGAATALVVEPEGSARELCTGNAHTTWIGFPLIKKPVVPATLQLHAHQTIVLCTDGIDPAIRTADAFWKRHGHTHPDALANDIYRTFASGKDDATVLCLRR